MRFATWNNSFASLQWFLFIFANTIVVPISVGLAFDLPQSDIAGIIRNSLVFTGIACVFQGIFGHRLPIMEGHSGVLWGTVLQLSVSGAAMGMTLPEIGGGIATGMLLAGLMNIVVGACGLLPWVKRIFSPMVVSVYLFLLTFQLILIFFDGMFAYTSTGALDMKTALLSLGVVILVCLLKIKGNKTLGNFSILIGMVVGWVAYMIVFPSAPILTGGHGSALIPIFPFGTPNLNGGIIMVTLIASFVSLSNTLASIRAGAELLQEKVSEKRINRSYMLTGVYSIGGSILGLVTYAPFASSIGFLESTQIFRRDPFLVGGGLMVLLGVLPYGAPLLATMPATVGNAVLFAVYLQLFGTSLKSIGTTTFNSVTIYRIALPVLAGLGIMSLNAEALQTLPMLVQPILSNGFVMGVLLSIALEMGINWKQP